MLYKYNNKSLTYERLSTGKLMAIAVMMVLTLSACLGFAYMKASTTKMVAYEDYVVMIDKIKDPFTPRKFYLGLVATKVRFPDIVWSQAVVESGFTSPLWRASNNPFGMKVARTRATTAMPESGEYAKYAHWKDAICDYALYQNAYLMDIRTEEEYYAYLQKRYAEDPDYIKKVKDVQKNFMKYMDKFDKYFITSK